MPTRPTLALVAIIGAFTLQVPDRPAHETIRISGDTPQYFLNRVTQVSVGPDGQVLVADLGEMVIRQFDSLGQYVRGIGRRGGGPGEFQSIALGWLGDTLYVIDAAAGRVSYFATNGQLLGDSPLPRFESPDAQSPVVAIRLVRGGGAIGVPRVGGRRSDPRGGPPVIAVLGWGRGETRHLATVGVPPGDVFVLPPPRPQDGPVTISRSPLGRLVARGHFWTTTANGTLFLANAQPSAHVFVATAIAFDGDTAFQREFRYDPIPVPKHLVDSLVLRQARMLRGLPLRLAERSVRDAFQPIDDFPPVSRILATADGHLWIAREDVPGSSRRWLVLDADGKPQFTTETPQGFDPMAVGPDWIWGTVADSLGIPSVRKLVVK